MTYCLPSDEWNKTLWLVSLVLDESTLILGPNKV